MRLTAIDKLLDAVEWRPIYHETDAENLGSIYATHQGVLTIGPVRLRVYQLNDGRRLIDADDMERFLGVQ